MAMNKTGTPTVLIPTNTSMSSAPIINPPGGSVTNRNEIVLPMFATLVPMLGIVLCLIAAIFVLARKRQRHLDNGGNVWTMCRQPHHRRQSTGGRAASSAKVNNGYKTPGNSPRALESPLNDNHFMLVQRNMAPLDLEEGTSSQLHEVGYGDISEDETSCSDDGSCRWSDASDDLTPRTTALRRASRHSGVEGTSTKQEIKVLRTISKSSSDGEMQEREKRDAVGPLPPVR